MAGNALLYADAVVALAEIRPGMRAADFGAGRTAHFALPLARTVGADGVVYAVDIHPEALSMLHGYRSHHELPQINVIRGDVERFGGVPGIVERSLDRIFIINTLWMTKRLADLVAETRRLLAPKGKIFVVDWEPLTQHPVAPIASLRVAPSAIDRMFAEGGCVRCGSFSPSRHHWGRIYSH